MGATVQKQVSSLPESRKHTDAAAGAAAAMDTEAQANERKRPLEFGKSLRLEDSESLRGRLGKRERFKERKLEPRRDSGSESESLRLCESLRAAGA
jgi:hypothetical protein